jgi:hypothetical protein
MTSSLSLKILEFRILYFICVYRYPGIATRQWAVGSGQWAVGSVCAYLDYPGIATGR